MTVDVADADVGARAGGGRRRRARRRPDLLCNNAGVFAGGTLWTEPVADFAWVMGVNFYGILHGIQAFVPGMIERGRPGPRGEHDLGRRALPVGVLRGVHDVEVRGARAHRVPRRRARGRGRADRCHRVVPGRGRTRGSRRRTRNRTDGARRSGPTTRARLRRAGARRSHRRAAVRRPRSRRWCSTRVRAGRYLQLTNDGYVGALRTRTDELLAGGLPGSRTSTDLPFRRFPASGPVAGRRR